MLVFVENGGKKLLEIQVERVGVIRIIEIIKNCKLLTYEYFISSFIVVYCLKEII